jgi:hypothetical protein
MLGAKQGAVMAGTQLSGWKLWLEADGRVRLFSVAENNRAEAERLALLRAPNATIVYGHALPHQVITLLKATKGQIVEWVSAEPGKPIEPPLRQKTE